MLKGTRLSQVQIAGLEVLMSMDQQALLDTENEAFKRLLVAFDPNRWVPKLFPEWLPPTPPAPPVDDLADLVDDEGNIDLEHVTIKYAEVPTEDEVNETMAQIRDLLGDRTGVITQADIDSDGWT